MDRNIIFSNLIWKYFERFSLQGIGFIISIILARLLSPEEYGIIAIVMVFISLASVFVESGFSTALIQKKEVDDTDLSSVLYLSLIISIFLYIIIFISAPFIAIFFNQPILRLVFRVLSINLVIGSVNSIQNTIIAKNMLFKKLFFSSFGAVTISGTIGVIAAYNGFGVWALVLQQITNQLVTVVLLWFIVKWRPKLIFSTTRIKALFSYGSKLLAAGLINVLYSDLRTLIIGRIYSPSMLGYYNRGQQFPQLIVLNINGSIQSVMLPAFSAIQDNRKRLKEMIRRSIVVSSFLVFPMMIGMAVVAEPIVKLILTDKWLPAVPFLQIFCISFALIPINTANLQAINAIGRSDIFLKLEIIKKIIGLTVLLISINFGIYAIAIGQVISGIISTFINLYPNKMLLSYSIKEQLMDIMPSFLIALIMGGVVYTFNYLNIAEWQTLILQVFSGMAIYIGLARIFKIESFGYLTNTIKQLVKSRKGVSN